MRPVSITQYSRYYTVAIPSIPGLTALITILDYNVIARTELTFLQNELRQCVNIAISFPIKRSSVRSIQTWPGYTTLPELINNAFNNRARHAAHNVCNSIDRCVPIGRNQCIRRWMQRCQKNSPGVNWRWNSADTFDISSIVEILK